MIIVSIAFQGSLLNYGTIINFKHFIFFTSRLKYTDFFFLGSYKWRRWSWEYQGKIFSCVTFQNVIICALTVQLKKKIRMQCFPFKLKGKKSHKKLFFEIICPTISWGLIMLNLKSSLLWIYLSSVSFLYWLFCDSRLFRLS